MQRVELIAWKTTRRYLPVVRCTNCSVCVLASHQEPALVRRGGGGTGEGCEAGEQGGGQVVDLLQASMITCWKWWCNPTATAHVAEHLLLQLMPA